MSNKQIEHLFLVPRDSRSRWESALTSMNAIMSENDVDMATVLSAVYVDRKHAGSALWNCTNRLPIRNVLIMGEAVELVEPPAPEIWEARTVLLATVRAIKVMVIPPHDSPEWNAGAPFLKTCERMAEFIREEMDAPLLMGARVN